MVRKKRSKARPRKAGKAEKAGRTMRAVAALATVGGAGIAATASPNNAVWIATFAAAFPLLMLFLIGAFDALAHVANEAYDLGADTRQVSWRIPDDVTNPRAQGFLVKLRDKAPSFAAMMWPGAPARDALELVALLRNSIHGDSFDVLGYRGKGMVDTEYPIAIPTSVRQEVLDSAKRLGGLERFGIYEVDEEGEALNVPVFVEAIIPVVMGALNELIRTMDISKLIPGGSPKNQLGERYGADALPRIRLLAGI